ncbi:MAG: cell division protein FtsZ [Candidatus Nealsonbacteria bacterium]|nr:cell division protein FtsZ [Candidatus Nealsonbacteria bacterium]
MPRLTKKSRRTKKSRKLLVRTPKKAVPEVVSSKPKEDLKLKRTRIRVIGVGDGGSAIVFELAPNLKRVDFLVANTDWRSRRKSSGTVKVFNFGEKFTRGLGTGMDPEIGRLSALAEKEKIVKFLKGSDLCFIVACLGGGTGSGAAPVFAKIAQQEGILTFGIFTLPFKFEGEKKIEIAREALEKMKINLNATLVLPNEKVFQALDKNASFNEGFSAINQALSRGLEGLIGLIFQPGLINIDFADLGTILDGRGKSAFLASCEFDKGLKVEEIKKKIFQSLFLSYNFRHARAVLFNIISDANLNLAEVSEISQLVFNAVHPEAKIIFGVSFNQKLSETIRVVLLAIGGRDKNLGSQRVKSPGGKPKKQKKRKEKPDKGDQDRSARAEEKVRRNALQIKEEVKAEEETLAAKERIWETPAILRRGFF